MAKVGIPKASAAATKLTAPAKGSAPELKTKTTAIQPVTMLLKIKNHKTVLIDFTGLPFPLSLRR